MTDGPTCPVCGETGNASYVNRPEGMFFCSCGSLFNGTDSEWRRWAYHRRMAAERPNPRPASAGHDEKRFKLIKGDC